MNYAYVNFLINPNFFASYTCDAGYEFHNETGHVVDEPVTITCALDETWVPATPGQCVRE